MSIMTAMPQGAAVEGINPNLLDNWYFVGGGSQQGGGQFPINQRGATSGQTTNVSYNLDRWKWSYGSSIGTWSLVNAGLILTPVDSVQMIQPCRSLTEFSQRRLTASVLFSDGTFYSGSETLDANGTAQYWSGDSVVLRSINYDFRVVVYETKTIVAVKLELGDQQTLAHQENGVWVLNEIPNYEEQLLRCQTSTADSNDRYANQTVMTNQKVSNPNLLDNWYFVGGGTGAGAFPVNQRGVTSYTITSAYQFDRWKAGAQAGTTALTARGVSITTPSGASSKRLIEQLTELKSDDVAGMKATLSVLTTSGLYTATDTLAVTSTSANRILLDLDNAGSLAVVNTQSGRGINVNIRAGVGITLTVIAVKLELGVTQTLAHNEGSTSNPVWVLNEIPKYCDELIKCQRYLYLLPRYQTARSTAIRSNHVYFSIPVPVPLAKQPSLEYASYLTVQNLSGTTTESGFTFSITQYSGPYIQIDATKTGHTCTDAVLSFGNTAPGVFISAEL